jgi:hypothetical protein
MTAVYIPDLNFPRDFVVHSARQPPCRPTVSTLVLLLHSSHQLPRMAERRRRRSHRGGFGRAAARGWLRRDLDAAATRLRRGCR